MSEITLVSRELTFFDMEFQESDVSSNEKLQNIINEVIESGESSSTAHMILGSIDYDNKQNLNEYIKTVVNFSFEANKYFNDSEPWLFKKKDPERMKTILNTNF